MAAHFKQMEYRVELATGVQLIVREKIPHFHRLNKALLLIHGSGVGSVCWDIPSGQYSLMNSLASDGLDVYAVECRGYGQSTKPNGLEIKTETIAEDICALLPRLAEKSGVPRLSLVGHSSGGTVALLAADRCPELVSRLVLIGTPYKMINPQFSAYARKVVELAQEPGKDYVPNLHYQDIEQRLDVHEPEPVAWYKQIVADNYSLIPGGIFPDLITNPGIPVVPRLDVPTMLLYGSNEYVVASADMESLFCDLKTRDKAKVLIPGGYHLTFLEKYGHVALNESISFWVRRSTSGVGQ